jgi:hypothetical protein
MLQGNQVLYGISLFLAPLLMFILRTKTTKAWVAIMIIVGGLAFPASRISRNEWLAHLADIALLIPMCHLAMQILFAQRR